MIKKTVTLAKRLTATVKSGFLIAYERYSDMEKALDTPVSFTMQEMPIASDREEIV